MTGIRPRVGRTLTIALMLTMIVAASLPVSTFAAGPSPAGAAPTHDKGKPDKPGKPDKGEACSRKDVKKNAEHGVPGPERWHLRLRTEDGKRLGVRRLKDGRCSPVLAIGHTYRVDARVPAELRPSLDGRTLQVQHREENGDTWKTVKEVPVGRDGRIRTTFRATNAMMHLREYRIAGLLEARGAAAPAAMTTVTSPTTTATGVSVTVVNIVNNSGNDLYLKVPTQDTGSGWGTVEIGLKSTDSMALIYQNVPQGIGSGFSMTKQKCFLGCTVYQVSWACEYCDANWKTSQLKDASGNYYPFCTGENKQGVPGADPQLVPGGTYTIVLDNGNPLAPYADFVRGYLTGPLDGLDRPSSTCLFGTTTTFTEWFDTHPLEVFLICVAASVAIVAILVVTGVVDAVAVGAAEELWAADKAIDVAEYVGNVIEPSYNPPPPNPVDSQAEMLQRIFIY